MDTPLHACLHRHLDSLISGSDGDIEATLERCLHESSLIWKGTGHFGLFLSMIRELRSQHPQGMSKRRSKRKAVVDSLVAKLLVIWEEQESDWWKGIATKPIATIVDKLKNIPDEHIDEVLDRLLPLPASSPHILDERIHEFLRRCHSRLARVENIAVPVVVAHIGHLIARGKDADANKLLEKFPELDRSELGTIVAYLRFVISTPVDLSGTTVYSTLSAEDLFLSACYYQGCASPTLVNQSHWDYESLKNALSDEEGGRALNDFKVRGLQPRIAELAFHNIYGLLHGTNAYDKLRDLNLECVRRLSPPWSLARKPNLPPADWEEGKNKARYDVKSNLFYSSHKSKNGLRGFLITIKGADTQQSFPGFVFTDTNDESCSWVYVGEYQPTTTMSQTEDRVLPFCFRLPDSSRCILSIGDHDSGLGMLLLKDPWLRIGWQFATGMKAALTQPKRSIAKSLLHTFVERCIEEAATTFLERALWMVMTDITLDACCQHDPQSVRSFLELVNKLLLSRALPIRLPRVAGTPILSLWITEVLDRLNDNWGRIQCPQCRRKASEPGMIQLRITRMTSEGTIEGEMTCTRCNDRSKVTLLTHCHKCYHYPLIIGKNPVCLSCGGLVCEWSGRPDGENRCKACKIDCGRGKHASEESFE